MEVFVMKNTIHIERHITDFIMEPKIAISLGMIVNELMTNVCKYAFKDQEQCSVSISLLTIRKHATFVIHDNGIGIDVTRPAGFGTTIVRMLVEQLNGTYSVENVQGTKSVLEFEL
jgi:two-component sensor histidine kinase